MALAIDLDQPDDAVLVDLARAWAERPGGTLDLLYVAGTHATTSWIRDEAARQLVATELDKLHHLAATRLTDLLDRLPEGMRGVARVLDGSPVPALVAASSAYDALLIATHGRRGLGHLWLGSVAERVVRGCGVPVLVVPVTRPAS